jgi:hypothetical protein
MDMQYSRSRITYTKVFPSYQLTRSCTVTRYEKNVVTDRIVNCARLFGGTENRTR